MAANIAAQIYQSDSFQIAWRRALTEYQENLPEEDRKNVNILDSEIQSVDDLMTAMARQHANFDKDTARGTVRSGAIRNSLSGVQTLINMFGGAASAAFPPCSQILGAVSVLMSAGQRVSGAFDEVSGLFTKISDFMTQLRPLTQVKMEPELETCVANIFVCTLRICGIATHKACHDETIEEIKEGHKFRKIWRQTKQKVMSNGSEYLRQLFMGNDPDITGAVSQLQRGVEAHQRMIAALTKKDTTEIKAVSVHIGELSTEIRETTIGIEQDVRELKNHVITIQSGVTQLGFGMDRVENSVEHLESGVSRIESGQVRTESEVAQTKVGVGRVETELKAGQKKQDEDTKLIVSKLDDLVAFTRSGAQVGSKPTSATATGKSKELTKILHPEPENKNLFNKFRDERVKGTNDWILKEPCVERWLKLDHTNPILIISGRPGSGKTFLSTRIAEELQDRLRLGGQDRPTSFAYFFCRKRPEELSLITAFMRTLASQILDVDPDYMSYLSADNRMKEIRDPSTVLTLWNTLFVDFFKARPSNSTMLIIDGIDECQNGDEGFEDFIQVLKDCIKDSVWTLPNVHLLVTVSAADALGATQEVNDVHHAEKLLEAFGETAFHFMIDESRTTNDLDAFVQMKLAKEWRGRHVPKKLRAQVHTTIKTHYKGDFLRTSLILEEVTSLSREDDIWALLSRPPKSVGEATTLVLRRICRHLDTHGHEDLVDILAWVAYSHTNLSLATLDAILTVRNYEGSRLIDLKNLMEKTYSALFVASKIGRGGGKRPQDDVRRRLGMSASGSGAPAPSPIDGAQSGFESYELDLSKQYHTSGQGDDPEILLAEMAEIEVRLADNIADRLQVVTEALATEDLQCKTLIACLRILCDPPDTVDKDAAERANVYCACHFHQHLLDVKVAEVEAKRTREIVRLLLKILRDETVIDRLVVAAENNPEDNTMTDILKPEVEKRLLDWLQSPDIQGRLPSADLKWIEDAVKSPKTMLYKGIAHGHARRWLAQDQEQNLVSNYSFICTYMRRISSEARPNGTEAESTEMKETSTATDTDNKSADENEYELGKSVFDSSVEEILGVAECAGLEKTSLWHLKAGTMLYYADKYDAAVSQLQEALATDLPDPQAHHQLGMIYLSWSYTLDDLPRRSSMLEKAIPCFSKAIEIYNSKDSTQSASASSVELDEDRLGKNKYFLAVVYRDLKRLEAAEDIYRSIFLDWEMRNFEKGDKLYQSFATWPYFDVLISLSNFDQAAEILEKLSNHPQSKDINYYMTYEALMHSWETMMQVAYRTNRFSLIDKFWRQATFVVACRGFSGEVSQVQLGHAKTIARLCPKRRAEAIEMLRMVIDDPESEHWMIESAEKELARIYLDLALESRDEDSWGDVDKYYRALNQLVLKEDGLGGQSFKDNECALFLASWYHLNRKFDKAKMAVKPLLKRQLDLLYDKEPDNDAGAWWIIGNLTLAVGDTERAKAATNMKGSLAAFENKTNIVNFEDHSEDASAEQNGNLDQKPQEVQSQHQESEDAREPLAEGTDDPIDKAVEVKSSPLMTPTDALSIDGVLSAASMPETPISGITNGESRETLQPADDQPSSAKNDVVDTSVNVELADDAVASEAESAKNGPSTDVDKTASEANEEQKSRGYNCDGPCFKDIIKHDEDLWRCKICATDLCDSCYTMIKNGKNASFAICSQMHDWIHMPPLKQCPDDMIWMDDKNVPILDWLHELADAYQIPRPSPEEGGEENAPKENNAEAETAVEEKVVDKPDATAISSAPEVADVAVQDTSSQSEQAPVANGDVTSTGTAVRST